MPRDREISFKASSGQGTNYVVSVGSVKWALSETIRNRSMSKQTAFGGARVSDGSRLISSKKKGPNVP
jgi:hypothetical protein